jgi:hypothetical protein
MRSLRDMNEWTDIDGPLHDLAIALGIIPKNSNFATEAKGIYWSNNPLGNFLGDTLYKMRDLGMLLVNDDGEFMWNPEYISPVHRLREGKVLCIGDGTEESGCGISQQNPGDTCKYCGGMVVSPKKDS